MKMIRELTLMLALLIGLACSVPFSEEFGDELQMSHFPSSEDPIQFDADIEGEETDAPPTPYGDDDVPNAPENADSQGEKAEIAGCTSPVYHGNTVAFQASYDKRSWLGCAPQSKCVKATCPRLLMTSSDFINCWGEVFRIYRQKGPGAVVAGDTVGIYYPRASKWFGCPATNCDLRTCPGTPHATYGMSSLSRWTSCWGEVFRIYAEGKSLGTVIEEHDKIMLHYPRESKWVGLVNSIPADKRTCPGTFLPPSLYRFDICWGEIFEITVR